MVDRSIAKAVADLVAWLDHATTMEVLRHLVRGDRAAAFERLRTVAPDLSPGLEHDPRFVETLIDELELRVSPSDEPDDLETREVPDYTRFARDQATDERPRKP